jgi:GxxExxY protein
MFQLGGRTMSEVTVQNRDQAISNQISEKVIGSAFKVGSALGSGFLKNVYENALLHEMTIKHLWKRFISTLQEVKLKIDAISTANRTRLQIRFE